MKLENLKNLGSGGSLGFKFPSHEPAPILRPRLQVPQRYRDADGSSESAADPEPAAPVIRVTVMDRSGPGTESDSETQAAAFPWQIQLLRLEVPSRQLAIHSSSGRAVAKIVPCGHCLGLAVSPSLPGTEPGPLNH